jgi:hypothetical protein
MQEKTCKIGFLVMNRWSSSLSSEPVVVNALSTAVVSLQARQMILIHSIHRVP